MSPAFVPSIRLRLAAWYTLALCLMLVVYGGATFVTVRHEFLEQLDDDLYEDFETSEGLISKTPDGGVSWMSDRHHDPDIDEDRGTDVWAANGEQIYRSRASSALPPPALTAASTHPRYDSLVANGTHWRTLTRTATVGGAAVVLRVARSEDRLRAQLQEILIVLVFGLPLVAMLAGVGGYILARRALTPIDRLGTQAKRITADRLHDRLSVPNERDEIGRLAAVINETFARLEASFDQLRRFTADASHELRTPLSVIRGIGEVGLGETRSPVEYKEAIGSMLEEVDRLSTLVDTLLRLSHGDAGTVRLSREPVDLGRLTRDVVASLSVLGEERSQRITVDDAAPSVATVDRLVIREAITNLLDNAIKYSPTGSAIDVRVRTDRDRAVIEVVDQGPGIGAAYRERIFDRFFRLDDARSRENGGTGLGLAIAKWAIDMHGGHISVNENPGGGSLFRMTLPLTGPTDSDRTKQHFHDSTQPSGGRS
jgi:heavy metal sensor kinase